MGALLNSKFQLDVGSFDLKALVLIWDYNLKYQYSADQSLKFDFWNFSFVTDAWSTENVIGALF